MAESSTSEIYITSLAGIPFSSSRSNWTIVPYWSPEWHELHPKIYHFKSISGCHVIYYTIFLYLSNMPCPPNMHIALYADDTAIRSQSWRPDTLSRRLSNAVTTLLKYFPVWKFRLKINKTETIAFSKCHPLLPELIKSSRPLTMPCAMYKYSLHPAITHLCQ
jgi:hypothetical protein